MEISLKYTNFILTTFQCCICNEICFALIFAHHLTERSRLVYRNAKNLVSKYEFPNLRKRFSSCLTRGNLRPYFALIPITHSVVKFNFCNSLIRIDFTFRTQRFITLKTEKQEWMGGLENSIPINK